MKQYMRSQKYDKEFIEENVMGPNSMWLLEDVCEHLEPAATLNVCDLIYLDRIRDARTCACLSRL